MIPGMILFIAGFFRGIGRFLSRIFRSGSKASRTASKTGSGLAAKKASPKLPPDDDELAEEISGGFETVLFRQLSRPRLSEQSASDLSLEEARRHLNCAEGFYTNAFSLFARSDFFYEEVEEEYLNTVLGLETNSIDARFLRIMSLFRKTLNDNTRRLMVWYAPVIFALSLVASISLSAPLTEWASTIVAPLKMQGLDTSIIGTLLAFAIVAFLAFCLSLLIFSWPFKVAQQRNLLNLDNYLTSKFARINHSFQVAKRRALNVERNKRMSQAEELKDEAGVWTLSYQWFATRLLLCELMIRNRLYQIRRNTTLYWLAGSTICILIGIITAIIVPQFLPDIPGTTVSILGATALYIILTFGIFQKTTSILFAVLEANEWSRFHLVDLHRTVQDHVGEDKVQIVTFRDRNRLE